MPQNTAITTKQNEFYSLQITNKKLYQQSGELSGIVAACLNSMLMLQYIYKPWADFTKLLSIEATYLKDADEAAQTLNFPNFAALVEHSNANPQKIALADAIKGDLLNRISKNIQYCSHIISSALEIPTTTPPSEFYSIANNLAQKCLESFYGADYLLRPLTDNFTLDEIKTFISYSSYVTPFILGIGLTSFSKIGYELVFNPNKYLISPSNPIQLENSIKKLKNEKKILENNITNKNKLIYASMAIAFLILSLDRFISEEPFSTSLALVLLGTFSGAIMRLIKTTINNLNKGKLSGKIDHAYASIENCIPNFLTYAGQIHRSDTLDSTLLHFDNFKSSTHKISKIILLKIIASVFKKQGIVSIDQHALIITADITISASTASKIRQEIKSKIKTYVELTELKEQIDKHLNRFCCNLAVEINAGAISLNGRFILPDALGGILTITQLQKIFGAVTLTYENQMITINNIMLYKSDLLIDILKLYYNEHSRTVLSELNSESSLTEDKKLKEPRAKASAKESATEPLSEKAKGKEPVSTSTGEMIIWLKPGIKVYEEDLTKVIDNGTPRDPRSDEIFAYYQSESVKSSPDLHPCLGVIPNIYTLWAVPAEIMDERAIKLNKELAKHQASSSKGSAGTFLFSKLNSQVIKKKEVFAKVKNRHTLFGDDRSVATNPSIVSMDRKKQLYVIDDYLYHVH